jgi:hypothetical protein
MDYAASEPSASEGGNARPALLTKHMHPRSVPEQRVLRLYGRFNTGAKARHTARGRDD